MNVLIVTYAIFPFSSGVSSYIATLASGLTAVGCQTDVIAYAPGRRHLYLLGQGRVVDTFQTQEAIHAEVGSALKSALPGASPEVLRHELSRYAFERALGRLPLEGYDVLHAQDVVAAWALSRVRPPGVPLVCTLHSYKSGGIDPGSSPVPDQLKAYLGAEERLGLQASERLVIPSRWLRRRLTRDHGLAENIVDVIPYGLDIGGFLKRAAAVPKGLTRPTGRALLLCPARLVPEKGHTHLLSALAQLRRHRRDFVCWLAGDGALMASLRRQGRRLDLGSHLVFLGERDDMASLAVAADLIVLPSLRDNLPYSIMEAQAAGKAVVASSVGGIPEMVEHGRTGLLVPPGAPGELASALRLLLAHPHLRGNLGREAARWARAHWDYRRMISETLSVYEKAAPPLEGVVLPERSESAGLDLDPRRLAALKQALRL